MNETDRQRWNQRYLADDGPPDGVAGFLVAQAQHLPSSGRALDVAGGAGRHARWLAERGLEVTLVDISDTALALARAAGGAVRLVHADVSAAGLSAAGPAGWDVIVIHHFLDRSLLATVPDFLAPGGVVLFSQPTETNLERNPRPGRAFLLGAGELAGVVARWQGMTVLYLNEGWTGGVHEARVVARRWPREA